jgi:hypothetical protein
MGRRSDEKQRANLPVSPLHLFLKSFKGDQLIAYPLLKGNFHLCIFLYIAVFATFILLSLFYYKLFSFFEPIDGKLTV